MKKLLSFWISSGVLILVVFSALMSRSSALALRSNPLLPPMTFTVTTNADMGAGSLRGAIDQANTNPGADMINFNPGIGTINVGSTTGMPLPAITEAVTIDGGASKVELNGAAAGAADGLFIMTNGVTIRNMVINNFSGFGIAIEGNGNFVQSNFIGTNAAGTAALPNVNGGVVVRGANNTIGGTTAALRNVISGNSGNGVVLNSVEATGNTVQGNFIGTDVTGTQAVGNFIGVAGLGGASGNTIGGVAAGAGNTISFNDANGIFLSAGGQNAILGNSIFSNSALGIDLSDDGGITANDGCDPDTGANRLQNFPVLTSAASGGGITTIQGTLNSTAVTTFRIEFFSSPSCDPSGNGEGAVFLGATNVATNAACIANINVNLGIGVPAGQVITATATDPANNTSEFCSCVTVMNAAVCSLNCPGNVVAQTGPTAANCNTAVSYPAPTTSGPCGPVTCTPPSGAVFAVGTTTVNCSAGGGAGCSFAVTVVDNTPPRLSCSTGITTTPPPGKTSMAVDYPPPTGTDNCSTVDIKCSPPSGSTFSIGTTLVTCTGTDSASNSALCFFNVTVRDPDGPVIVCPANVNASPAPGQTSAVVTYPPPTVTDNLPGVSAVCAPASGSTFPLGTTPVTCTATDANGNQASCSFTVSVGGPQAKVTIVAGGTSVEFGNPTPIPGRRKPQKTRNNPCSLFIIENIGFAPLVLTFDSINRVGANVDNGRIGAPNDLRYFTLSLVAGQSQTEMNVGDTVTIQARGAQTFCLRFNPLLPALAGKTTGIAAADDLPDTMTSRVTFRQNAGTPISVPVLSHVGTAVTLIDPTNPRKSPVVTFARSGNNFNVSFAVHDSNGDISKAKYEFLNGSGQVIGEAFEVDLAEPIRTLNPVRGQSVGIEQSFTGANDHPEVTGVRVTVFDGETSVTGSASAISTLSAQLSNHKQGVTLYLPETRLKPLLPF